MPKDNQVRDLFEDKVILVTGGLGSIGSELSKQLLLYNPKEIRILDNRETELSDAMRNCNIPNMRFFFGDIREKEQLFQLMDGVDVVFHTAALKHVTVCEYNPFEAIKTNVIGTQNVIECALKRRVEKMILISTDKAVDPTNVLGATKLLAERLVSAMYYQGNRDNMMRTGVVRFGNVLASRGSVLRIWERQLKEGKKITVTNPKMTRFFMSIPESIRLIFNASYYAENGEIFILKMRSVRIGDLAEVFLELMGYQPDYYEIIGMRIGEKFHEDLISKNETGLLLENEILFVRLPMIFAEEDELSKYNEYIKFMKLGFRQSEVRRFSSGDKNLLMNKEEIKEVLESWIETT